MAMDDQLHDFSDYPKNFELKDGTQCRFRPMRSEDRDRLYKFFKSLTQRERRHFKHDVTQREVITNWCTDIDYDRVLPILAVTDQDGEEKVIADGTLHAEQHGWATHVAQVRMVIHPKYRKKSLGRLMLRELYERAIKRGVEKIQTMVRDDDEDSIALVKRLGFKREATFRNHATDARGRKHDVIVFFNDLSELWQKMDDLNIDSDFVMVP